MPVPRKIDRIPADLRQWLQDALRESGFGGYVELTDELNAKLEERGEEIRLGKSAVHAFGQDFEAFVKAQEQAAAWAESWMADNGLEDEAKRHNVLFQMVTTLAFKVMSAQMTKEGDEIDPKELHFIGRMLKDVMTSSGIREKLLADERAQIAKEAREAAASAAENVAREQGLSGDTVQAIRASILGVAA
ncbi:phage protein Gp27 family protein [Pseudaestuariivita sp.]|uniref:phage protein Gp27 family protein n=1 Tax=Pseudaestuariivita sp. TaxID=2211669 RepID=UPI004058AE80